MWSDICNAQKSSLLHQSRYFESRSRKYFKWRTTTIQQKSLLSHKSIDIAAKRTPPRLRTNGITSRRFWQTWLIVCIPSSASRMTLRPNAKPRSAIQSCRSVDYLNVFPLPRKSCIINYSIEMHNTRRLIKGHQSVSCRNDRTMPYAFMASFAQRDLV